MLARRRFLTILAGSAAALTSSGQVNAGSIVWQGQALGAQAEIRLSGDRGPAAAALAASRDTLERIENLFSLYKPSSALNQLNKTGFLKMPPEFARLIGLADHIHENTGGLFDPTVQPIMTALARSKVLPSPRELQLLAEITGWQKVVRTGSEIFLTPKGMVLTLNGIAQGFATDRVVEVLQSHGFEPALVHVGEYRAGSTPARIGIAGSTDQILNEIQLQSAAIATSAPFGTRFQNGSGHIVRPDLRLVRPRWRSVTVEASSAALADGYSTALALTKSLDQVRELTAGPDVQTVWLEDREGQLLKI